MQRKRRPPASYRHYRYNTHRFIPIPDLVLEAECKFLGGLRADVCAALLRIYRTLHLAQLLQQTGNDGHVGGSFCGSGSIATTTAGGGDTATLLRTAGAAAVIIVALAVSSTNSTAAVVIDVAAFSVLIMIVFVFVVVIG